MTRPIYGVGSPACFGSASTAQQCRQACMGPPGYAFAGGVGGSYSASMTNMICNGGSSGNCRRNGSTTTHERRHSKHSSGCPPFSTSHIIATNLGDEYPQNSCRDSRSLFCGFVDAIERHILHSEPSGNVKISSSRLHIGECPEVPEDRATFALRRTGSLQWLEPRPDDAAEADRLRDLETAQMQAFNLRERGLLGHHSSSEPKLTGFCDASMKRATTSTASDLSSLSAFSDATTLSGGGGDGGIRDSPPPMTPGTSGLRRAFSWHRIKDKLKK